MAKIVVDAEDLLSVDEAAVALKMSVPTVWRWIRDNKINVLRISGRTLIPQSEVTRLLKEKEMAPGV